METTKTSEGQQAGPELPRFGRVPLKLCGGAGPSPRWHAVSFPFRLLVVQVKPGDLLWRLETAGSGPDAAPLDHGYQPLLDMAAQAAEICATHHCRSLSTWLNRSLP